MSCQQASGVCKPKRETVMLTTAPASNRRFAHHTTVDVAVGCGHPDMDMAALGRGLARIAAKGIRTARVRTLGGVLLVMTKDLPEGVVAVRTLLSFEAVKLATEQVLVTI